MRHPRHPWSLLALLTTTLLVGCPSTPGDGDDDDDAGDDDAGGPVEIDLSTYPDSGEAVESGTVLDDQWQSIGVLFDASPDHIDPIMADWGSAHLFFDPDEHGAVAILRFVEPGTDTPVAISAFELAPWFQAGESAELVGLDADGEEVAEHAVTPDDIGAGEVTIVQSISGSFQTVQWRTHGDPGIAANTLIFTP